VLLEAREGTGGEVMSNEDCELLGKNIQIRSKIFFPCTEDNLVMSVSTAGDSWKEENSVRLQWQRQHFKSVGGGGRKITITSVSVMSLYLSGRGWQTILLCALQFY
jgi:hypothetical protein